MNTNVEIGQITSLKDSDVALSVFFEDRWNANDERKKGTFQNSTANDWLTIRMREMRLEKKLYNALLSLKKKTWIFLVSKEDRKIIFLLPLMHAISAVQPELNILFRESLSEKNHSIENNPSILLILDEENKIAASWKGSSFYETWKNENLNESEMDEAVLNVQMEFTALLKNI